MSCTLHNIGNMYLYRYSRAEGAENAGLESAGLENAGPGKRRCIYEIIKIGMTHDYDCKNVPGKFYKLWFALEQERKTH